MRELSKRRIEPFGERSSFDEDTGSATGSKSLWTKERGTPSAMNVNQQHANGSLPNDQGSASGRPDQPIDYRRQALAVGLELAKNATRARTFDEVQFILVNDTRALIPFDRGMLILHLDGKSFLAATNNQPQLEARSDFVRKANDLAPSLREVDRAVVLFAKDFKAENLPDKAAASLQAFVDYFQSSCIMLIPLSVYDNVIGHLVLEFFDQALPGEVETVTLLNMVPFLSSAVSDKWFLKRNRSTNKSFFRMISGVGGERVRPARWGKIALLLIVVALVAIGLTRSTDLRIGGTAEVAPEQEYYAFVELDGIMKNVLVKSGDRVDKGQLLALLDDQEIDYEIREAMRLLQSYKKEIQILRNMGAEKPSKLAEAKLVAIKAQRAQQKIEFLTWKKRFIEIRAPSSGTILTEQIDTLIGKRFKAGEPFCTIAPEEHLLLDIFIKESDVGYVQVGQRGEVFFNFRPDESYRLRVRDIAPKAEAKERLRNVFRVRATFEERPDKMKPGMQGIAHITTEKAAAWFVVSRRARTKINELLLAF